MTKDEIFVWKNILCLKMFTIIKKNLKISYIKETIEKFEFFGMKMRYKLSLV